MPKVANLKLPASPEREHWRASLRPLGRFFGD